MLFTDIYIPVNSLSDEDAGKLFKTILEYQNSGKVQNLSPSVNIAFAFIKQQLDRCNEKYEETCKKNSKNIKKRWNKIIPIDTIEYDRIPVNTKHTYPDPDPDPDPEKKKDKNLSSKKDDHIQIDKNKQGEITKYFFEKYQEKMDLKPAWGGKEGSLLKQDLKRLDNPKQSNVEIIKMAIDLFFEDKVLSVVKFVKEKESAGYTYGVFHGVLDSILLAMKKK